ncbi:hypothetical protein RYX36_032333, partial [Vicia faba]
WEWNGRREGERTPIMANPSYCESQTFQFQIPIQSCHSLFHTHPLLLPLFHSPQPSSFPFHHLFTLFSSKPHLLLRPTILILQHAVWEWNGRREGERTPIMANPSYCESQTFQFQIPIQSCHSLFHTHPLLLPLFHSPQPSSFPFHHLFTLFSSKPHLLLRPTILILQHA